MGRHSNDARVSVVVCAYTEDRWGDLVAGVDSVLGMTSEGDEIVLVVDHNEPLLSRARGHFFARLIVIPNTRERGLSGARTSGVAATTGDIVAFLDDDAMPLPGWLDAFRLCFASDPLIAAVGGAIKPAWEGGREPRWFPPEFGWVLGCDYRGLPGDGGEIRNPIGASMAVRREWIQRVGGFSSLVGRVGTKPTGNEETELAIRIRQADPRAKILRATTPVVRHRVPRSRQTVRYLVRRCYHEGRSKAALTRSVGARDGLSSERAYVVTTLLTGLALHLRDAWRGEPAGVARACLLPVGLMATSTGFLIGRLTRRVH